MSEQKKVTATQAKNALRQYNYERLAKFFESEGEEVLQVKGNSLSFPQVDALGNGVYAVVTVTIPNGARGSDGYDGHAEAEAYAAEQAKKAKEAEEAAAEKARKAAEKEAKKAAK